MKKLGIFFLILLFVACDEGLIIKVPASSSVSAVMPASVINAQADNLFEESETVDLADFVSEDSEDIDAIKLDRLTYELSGYNNTSGSVVLMDLTIQTRLNGTTTDILVVSGLTVGNTGEILAFEDGNPASILSATQVASLESIMDNLQPFDFIISADFTDDIESDFTVALAWDITISVSQDTGG